MIGGVSSPPPSQLSAAHLSLLFSRLPLSLLAAPESCTRLEELRLYGNRLARLEGAAFGHLTNLRVLDAGRNRIARVERLPPSLESLAVDSNALTQVPVSLARWVGGGCPALFPFRNSIFLFVCFCFVFFFFSFCDRRQHSPVKG